MSDDIQIYNCHTHLFTMKHIPIQLYGLFRRVAWLFRYTWFRIVIQKSLELIGWFGANGKLAGYADMIPHLAAFAETMEMESQEEVFTKKLELYYPSNTCFVVLPMDFSNMGYGEPVRDIKNQHDTLAALRDNANKKSPDKIIPFTHFDPRGDNALEQIKEYITTKDFKGVKIYPPMRYLPTDDQLTEVYKFCNEYGNGLPVMTHCSAAHIRNKEYARAEHKHIASQFCDPVNYIPILEKYKKLRLCLGHFGGNGAWESYLNFPNYPENKSDHKHPERKFLRSILNMLQSGKYLNLFVDISYVIFSYRENINVLKVLLEKPQIRSQVLFGTDFYIVEMEEFSEKQLSMFLRAAIGEKYYKEIAETNPRRYLFGE